MTKDRNPDSEPKAEAEGRAKEAASGAMGATGSEAPERVDWSAILEQRALVADSEVASPVALPEVRAIQAPRQRRRLLYVLVAVAAVFSVVASAAVVFTLWQSNRAEEPAPAAVSTAVPDRPPTPTAAAPISPTTSTAPAAEPAVPPPPAPPPPSAASEATASPEPPAEKQSAEEEPTEEEPAEMEPAARARAEKPAKPRRSSHSRSKSGSGEKSATKPEREAKSAPASEPAEEPTEQQTAEKQTAGGLVEPTAKDVAKAVESIQGSIEACGKEHGVNGLGKIRLQVEPSGSVAWAAIREGGEAFQSCIQRLFRGVRLPRSQKGGTFVHTVTIP